MKAVFHFSQKDTEKAGEVIGNIQNLLKDKMVEIEEVALVVNAEAVKFLEQDSPAEQHIEGLIEEDVRVKACSNSLENREIKGEELIEGVETVSSAVGELTRLQDDGYSYIRP